MTEEYLHQIWKDKRIPFHNLKPINAFSISVRNTGVYNENQKGPDFYFGQVQIDGVDFYGNIELHVKSSDWYKHNHHEDEAYNNVILHVVYEYDKPVIQNGFIIPTFELKSYIDNDHYHNYVLKAIFKNEFPCSKMLRELDPIYLETVKMKAFIERMDAKNRLLLNLNLSEESILYHLLASAFGTSINKEGFIELTNKVPYKNLRVLNSSKQKSQLLMVESGLIHDRKKIGNSMWHFKGTRPENFPTIRIKQFAYFISKYDFDTAFTFLESREIKNEFFKIIDGFWNDDKCEVQKLSRAFSNSLIINAIVPFLWYKSELLEDERLKDKAIEMLETIPPESNKFTTKWKKCSVEVKNSFDSQSLLSLYRYYCSGKKCLSCSVGIKLME